MRELLLHYCSIELLSYSIKIKAKPKRLLFCVDLEEKAQANVMVFGRAFKKSIMLFECNRVYLMIPNTLN